MNLNPMIYLYYNIPANQPLSGDVAYNVILEFLDGSRDLTWSRGWTVIDGKMKQVQSKRRNRGSSTLQACNNNKDFAIIWEREMKYEELIGEFFVELL